MLGLTPPATVRAILGLIQMAAKGERVKSYELTDRMGLPARGLEGVLQILASEGILDSIQGPFGGYKLARSDVTLRDLVLALRPTNQTEPTPLPKQVRSALEKAEEAYLSVLSEVKISSLVPR